MDAVLDYYRRRTVEEIAAAASALDSRVSSTHRELGRLYNERALAIEALQRRSQFHLVGAD